MSGKDKEKKTKEIILGLVKEIYNRYKEISEEISEKAIEVALYETYITAQDNLISLKNRKKQVSIDHSSDADPWENALKLFREALEKDNKTFKSFIDYVIVATYTKICFPNKPELLEKLFLSSKTNLQSLLNDLYDEVAMEYLEYWKYPELEKFLTNNPKIKSSLTEAIVELVKRVYTTTIDIKNGNESSKTSLIRIKHPNLVKCIIQMFLSCEERNLESNPGSVAKLLENFIRELIDPKKTKNPVQVLEILETLISLEERLLCDVIAKYRIIKSIFPLIPLLPQAGSKSNSC